MRIDIGCIGKEVANDNKGFTHIPSGIVTSMEWYCAKCGKIKTVSLYKNRKKTTKTD
jgi:hypothetical protein